MISSTARHEAERKDQYWICTETSPKTSGIVAFLNVSVSKIKFQDQFWNSWIL